LAQGDDSADHENKIVSKKEEKVIVLQDPVDGMEECREYGNERESIWVEIKVKDTKGHDVVEGWYGLLLRQQEAICESWT
jgi:poly(A) polymerase Pap1